MGGGGGGEGGGGGGGEERGGGEGNGDFPPLHQHFNRSTYYPLQS